MKSVKFLPLVALAAFSLLTLKMAGMILGEGYMLTGTKETVAKAIPDAVPLENGPQNGKAEAEKPKGKKGNSKKPQAPRDVLKYTGDTQSQGAEMRLLTSLSKRRKQLDKRAGELELRFNLIKAAEKRIDQRIVLLKKLEQKIQTFAKVQKEEKKVQFKRLVKMYSSMKPKGAARIFNELDKQVLLGIIKEMKPQAMSAILAAMEPAKAREMTISLAGVAKKEFTRQNLDTLPKISGQ